MPKMRSPLVAGLAVALAATCLFGVIAAAALVNSPLVELDKKIALNFKEASDDQPILRACMIALTHSGGVPAMALLAFFGVVWEAWRGRGRWPVAVGWALIMIGGALLNQGVKTTLKRQRPPVEWRDAVVHETNESFPSGHAMGGTIGIGLLGYALFLRDPRRGEKILIVALLGAWVLFIGFSRVYLRAHWFSDVLGGCALGLAWLSLGLGIMETWRRQRSQETGVRSQESGLL